MFKILGLMILGIIIGYGLRRISFLRKVEVSISYTVFLLLFVLGVTIRRQRQMCIRDRYIYCMR